MYTLYTNGNPLFTGSEWECLKRFHDMIWMGYQSYRRYVSRYPDGKNLEIKA
jgi:hypothetical protein